MSRVLQAAREALAIATGDMDPEKYLVHAADAQDNVDPGIGPGEIDSGQTGSCDLPAKP